MAGISEKRVKVIVGTSRKSRKIRQHRVTKTTQNLLCPKQRSQVTKMRHQNMPVHCQRVLWADVPAVDRFQGKYKISAMFTTVLAVTLLLKAQRSVHKCDTKIRCGQNCNPVAR